MAAILSRPQCVKDVNDRQWKTGRSTGSYMNRYILIEHISILCNYVYRYVCICVDMHARASAHMYIYAWVCIITHNLKCMLQHVMILPPTLLFIYIWIILYTKTRVRDDFNNIYIYVNKVSIWNVNCAWSTAFNFDSRTDVILKVSKCFRQKNV